ncbi:MAG: hypothetical protein EON58_19380 [Alphaproteobacteria bacterium]|nr:MAG: hypothetical protein EON58_19380 [Alphaproteobacteria bacterium]
MSVPRDGERPIATERVFATLLDLAIALEGDLIAFAGELALAASQRAGLFLGDRAGLKNILVDKIST